MVPPGPYTTLSTPGGRPASVSACARFHTDSGVIEAGLSTTALPETNAGAVFQAGMAMGKFHGVMMPATPSGSRRV
jgi:hypothetical protein